MKQRRTVVVAMVALLASARAAQEEAAGGAADPTAAAGRRVDDHRRPPAPPEPVREPVPVPPEPIASRHARRRPTSTRSTRTRPFQPVFFAFDRTTSMRRASRRSTATPKLMKKYPTWIDHDRGALGRARYGRIQPGAWRAPRRWRRATIWSRSASRPTASTVSYGKEFPFEPGHDETSWSKNRRAHFVVTSK